MVKIYNLFLASVILLLSLFSSDLYASTEKKAGVVLLQCSWWCQRSNSEMDRQIIVTLL